MTRLEVEIAPVGKMRERYLGRRRINGRMKTLLPPMRVLSTPLLYWRKGMGSWIVHFKKFLHPTTTPKQAEGMLNQLWPLRKMTSWARQRHRLIAFKGPESLFRLTIGSFCRQDIGIVLIFLHSGPLSVSMTTWLLLFPLLAIFASTSNFTKG